MTQQRDERAWLAVMDRVYRAEGKVALHLQTCRECGSTVATRLGGVRPATCREHS